jgi:hypothetical protein
MSERLMNPGNRHYFMMEKLYLQTLGQAHHAVKSMTVKPSFSRCRTRDSFGIQSFQSILDSCVMIYKADLGR